MLKPLPFLISLMLFFSSLKAQEQSGNSFEISPQVSIAVFTAQHKLTGTAYGGELLYHINTQSNPSAWMRSLNLNSIDIAFNYKNMSNIKLQEDPKPGVFGNSYALLAGLNISLLKFNKTALQFSPAFGMGYIEKTFFTNENPLIGSHINFASRVSLKIITSIFPSTQLSAGLDVLHFSNAAFRVPNNGINSSSVSIGVIQSLKPGTKQTDTAYHGYNHRKHTFDIGINIGRRGVFQKKEGYFRTGLYTGYNYRLIPVMAISGGIDAVYYHSVFDPSNYNQTYQSYATSYDHWRLGAAIGPDLLMGRLTLMLKYGYYLYYNSYREVNTYWTAGLKYSVVDWAAIQAKMYTHKTEADFAGFGLIFTL